MDLGFALFGISEIFHLEKKEIHGLIYGQLN